MPELVSNGPRIPVHLMNEVDTGSVIFFCGAGVSGGDGSGLPDFAELVDHVYEANRMDPMRSRGKPSIAMSRIRILGGLNSTRPSASWRDRNAWERLSCGAPSSIASRHRPPRRLRVHEALIALSPTEQGVRLVTTNFDRRFVETFFKTIKSELIWKTVFMSRSQAETAIAGYIDGFYNPVRRHSTLDFTRPVKFEAEAMQTV